MNAGGANTFELETQAVLSELRESLAATLEPFRPEVIRADDLKLCPRLARGRRAARQAAYMANMQLMERLGSYFDPEIVGAFIRTERPVYPYSEVFAGISSED